ncbi:MAG: ATP-binding cassette domain-containing protein [Firmicutes bacterium]|nr:ATP-binding cassette domain-containing protein [Bacillota bacterium]
MEQPLIETKDLRKYFKTPKGNLHAVDGINLSIKKGNTLGVVGESGCGKSTLGRTILRLIEPTSGEVLYNGDNIIGYDKRKMNQMRKKMQIIFQDPYASLNPRMTVSQIIAEPMIVCKTVSSRRELNERVYELMDKVGLADRLANSYPHELDGGRRQRIGIARALALNPEFIVCDEPVSALDVSIQAQSLNMLMDLQESMDLTYMFITHDLSVVKHISDQIMVMYLGVCVEMSPTDDLFKSPLHTYTQALLDAIPVPSLKFCTKTQNIIKGEITSPINPQSGCRFVTRCPKASAACTRENLEIKEVSQGHFVACVLY